MNHKLSVIFCLVIVMPMYSIIKFNDENIHKFFLKKMLHSKLTGKQIKQEIQSRGIDVNQILHNRTLLLCALISGRDIATIQTILQAGANPNWQDKYGENALHKAIRRNYSADVVALLIQHGANPTVQNKRGSTALNMESDKKYSDQAVKDILSSFIEIKNQQ